MVDDEKTTGTPQQPSGPAPQKPKTSTGMDPKVESLLCYLLTWITGLIFYLIEKDNKDVRFHALQSILFGVAWVGVWIVLGILSPLLILSLGIGVIMSLLWFASYVVFLILWIMLMVKAYQGERWKLPVIGDIAEKNA